MPWCSPRLLLAATILLLGSFHIVASTQEELAAGAAEESPLGENELELAADGEEESEEELPAAGWRIGKNRAELFVFQVAGEAKVAVEASGAVWGSYNQGYFKATKQGDSDQSPGSDALRQDARISSGDWNLGETENGDLGLFSSNRVALVVQGDGGVWASGQNGGGFLEKRDANTAQKDALLPRSGKVLKTGSSLNLANWTIGETLDGNLAFYKETDLKAFIHRDGDMWGAKENGWFAPIERNELDVESVTEPLSTMVTDCEVSQWYEYGKCTKSCGGGEQVRLRHVVKEAANGGADCPELKESRACETHGCPTDCEVQPWTEWGSCDRECGGGKQSRTRHVFTYPSSTGASCPPLHEERPCNLQGCGTELCADGIAAGFMKSIQTGESMFVFTNGAEGKAGSWIQMNPAAEDPIESGPHLLNEHPWFKRLPTPFDTSLDAAYNSRTNTDVMMFAEDMWLLWDPMLDRPSRGPFRMREHEFFEALPEPFSMKLSAACNILADDQVLLFSTQAASADAERQQPQVMYLTWNSAENSVVSGPYASNDPSHSLGLPDPFNSRIDAAINSRGDSSIVYLFSGFWWLEFDTSVMKVAAGPYRINHNPTMEPMMSSLNLCAGFDLGRLGNFTANIDQLRPIPVVKERVVAGSRIPGYQDSEQMDPDTNETVQLPLASKFSSPSGLSIVGQGDSQVGYMADTGNNCIRRVSVSKGTEATSTVAGSTEAGFMDGAGGAARFRAPRGISAMRIEGEGDVLYVADTDNHAIRRIFVPADSTQPATVSTVAGGGTTRCNTCIEHPTTSRCTGCCGCQVHGFEEGSGPEAKFFLPNGVSLVTNMSAIGAEKNEYVYVADTHNHAIRRITVPPGGSVGETSTIAGGALKEHEDMQNYVDVLEVGQSGFKDGSGSEALFDQPRDLVVLRYQPEQDTVYVADEQNNAVRVVVVSTNLAAEDDQSASRTLLGSGTAQHTRGNQMTVQSLSPQKQGSAKLHLSKPAAVGSGQAEDPAESAEADSQAVYRFTTPGGTAGADVQCDFPFIFDGQGYNDCTTATKEEYGITADKFVKTGDNPTNSWCRTSADDAEGELMGWGPCMPSGYMPDYCVVTPWTSWSRCGAVCGGSSATRTRTVEHEGESQSECPHLNETKACNTHACGNTATVAGGFTVNQTDDSDTVALGIGYVDTLSSPDLTYRPHSISALRHNDTDVVFLAGDSAKTARIRRIDITLPRDNCSSLDDFESNVQECRQFVSAGRRVESRVAGVIGTPIHFSTSALSATSEASLYLVASNKLSMLDLTLQVPCATWIGTEMMAWNFNFPEETSMESHPLQVELRPEYGLRSLWEFGGYRQRKMFTYAGEEIGFTQKNTMCMQRMGDDAEYAGPRVCCTFKEIPELRPLEGATECASEDPDDSEGLDCSKIEADTSSRKIGLLNAVKLL